MKSTKNRDQSSIDLARLGRVLVLLAAFVMASCDGTENDSKDDPFREAQALERLYLSQEKAPSWIDHSYIRVVNKLNNVPKTDPHYQDAKDWLHAVQDSRRLALTNDPRYQAVPDRLAVRLPQTEVTPDSPVLFVARWHPDSAQAAEWVRDELLERAPDVVVEVVDVAEDPQGWRRLHETVGIGSPLPVLLVPEKRPVWGFRPIPYQRWLGVATEPLFPGIDIPSAADRR